VGVVRRVGAVTEEAWGDRLAGEDSLDLLARLAALASEEGLWAGSSLR
jgi:hypothetical protein